MRPVDFCSFHWGDIITLRLAGTACVNLCNMAQCEKTHLCDHACFNTTWTTPRQANNSESGTLQSTLSFFTQKNLIGLSTLMVNNSVSFFSPPISRLNWHMLKMSGVLNTHKGCQPLIHPFRQKKTLHAVLPRISLSPFSPENFFLSNFTQEKSSPLHCSSFAFIILLSLLPVSDTMCVRCCKYIPHFCCGVIWALCSQTFIIKYLYTADFWESKSCRPWW